MTVSDGETVDQLILDHLAKANLPQVATDLILAAMLGPEELASVLGGAPPRRPQPAARGAPEREPMGTYLASIEVTGFRGIGPTSPLNLHPGPGLTIVTGRNGSGKSSFAEAAEFALTGDNKRWAGRSTTWQEGWRNLHASDDSRIRVRLGVEGHRNGAVVECHWKPGDGLTDCTTFLQLAGRPRQSIADLGWEQPLELYRPFLSYAELGGLLSGKPSEMYDSLQRILGLGRLVEIEDLLKAARKDMDDRRTVAAERSPQLRAVLADHPDPRAREAEAALAGKVADLDRLETLATVDDAADDAAVALLRHIDVLALPERDHIATEVVRLRDALSQIDDLASTPAKEARAVAGLLRDALRHYDSHPDQPCPVCHGRTLDQAWAKQARLELERLTQRAEQLDEAHRVEQAACRALREAVPTQPPTLARDLSDEGVDTGDLRIAWQHWDDVISSADSIKIADQALGMFDALSAALRQVQATARQALERRQRAWRPIADQIRAWVATERESRHAAEMYRALRTAVAWLQRIGKTIRNERLAPLAAEATRIWTMLRQESNVDLGAIRLTGAGTRRRVDFAVTVDGVPGAALSVMSQGELHSLALALFLPRATMAASPFRFLVIDDPVQSMDPAKVYGLAQVLADVAKDRQVIVFTHDDRLPAAVRHLKLKARIVIVSRLAGSQVKVSEDKHSDPAQRYLDDAWAIARDEEMAYQVRGPLVCSLIRDALEYTCHELIRARDFAAGVPIAQTEARIAEAESLRPTLALALLGDAKRHGNLSTALTKVHPAAARVVAAANNGVHGHGYGSLTDLVDNAQRVVARLAQA